MLQLHALSYPLPHSSGSRIDLSLARSEEIKKAYPPAMQCLLHRQQYTILGCALWGANRHLISYPDKYFDSVFRAIVVPRDIVVVEKSEQSVSVPDNSVFQRTRNLRRALLAHHFAQEPLNGRLVFAQMTLL